MTFIASVKAKKGVAIIADSLVTSTSQILHYNNFLDFLKDRPGNKKGERTLKPEDIVDLFDQESLFTKDFEETYLN